MSSANLVFSSTASTSTYSLLSLPNELKSQTLEIRGSGTNSAVLVTETETFSIQGTQHSNSFLLMLDATESDEEEEENKMEGTKVIESTLHETLNLVRTYPSFLNLPTLLIGTEYYGEVLDGEVKILRFEMLQDELSASDQEIRSSLIKLRVLELNGRLRLLPSNYLIKILPVLLQGLIPKVEFGTKVEGKGKKVEVSVEDYEMMVESDSIEEWMDSVDLDSTVANGILNWFGKKELDGNWKLNISQIVREIGIGLLAAGGHAPQSLSVYLEEWSNLVYCFSPLSSLSLLSSTHLLPSSTPQQILFFPLSRLSPDPFTRFNELFGQKPKWSETEMIEFIDDLVGGEKKKREAMVLKFVRKVKEGGKVFWTARNLW